MIHLEEIANRVIGTCPSTNDLAKKLAAAEMPHGTWVSARTQTQGRGRLGRGWNSPVGNLYLSWVMKLAAPSGTAPREMSWIPLTTAVGVTQYLRKQFPQLDIKVKWPNDIWLEGKKLGGILCESSSQFSQCSSTVIIGLGLNCRHFPLDLELIATSLYHELLAQSLSKDLAKNQTYVDLLRLPLLKSVLEELDHLQAQGPQRVRELYGMWAQIRPGTEIQWENRGLKKGKVIGPDGLGSSGELCVQQENQEEGQKAGQKAGNDQVIRLFAEEVRVLLR